MYVYLSICLHVSVSCVPAEARRGRASDRLERELQSVLATIWCWELNLGPLQEHQLLLTAEPSFHPACHFLSHQSLSLLLQNNPDSIYSMVFKSFFLTSGAFYGNSLRHVCVFSTDTFSLTQGLYNAIFAVSFLLFSLLFFTIVQSIPVYSGILKKYSTH